MDARHYPGTSVFDNDTLSGALCRFRPNELEGESTLTIPDGAGRLGSRFAGESYILIKSFNFHYQGMGCESRACFFSVSLAKGPVRPKHSSIDGIWDVIHRGLPTFHGGPLHIGFCNSQVPGWCSGSGHSCYDPN